MTIVRIYVFALIIIIIVANEIGQKITNTDRMEFADIAYGVVEIRIILFAFSAARGIWHLIYWPIRWRRV